jgi:hypothetical protein
MLPEVESLATVVLCEDDEVTRELLRDHLTADRYAVLPAPDASRLSSTAASSSPTCSCSISSFPTRAGAGAAEDLEARTSSAYWSFDVVRTISIAGRFIGDLLPSTGGGVMARPATHLPGAAHRGRPRWATFAAGAATLARPRDWRLDLPGALSPVPARRPPAAATGRDCRSSISP